MDIRLLNLEIAKNGMTGSDVAKELGMSEAAFMWKMAKGLIGSEEAEKLIRLLAITNPAPIFFNKKVTPKVTKVGRHDGLSG